MTPSDFQLVGVSTLDIYLIDPFSIDLAEGAAGRRQPTTAEVEAMAYSLFAHGQRREVECESRDGRLVLRHGLVRTLAARLIRTRHNCLTADGVKVSDRRFKLKVVIDHAVAAEPGVVRVK